MLTSTSTLIIDVFPLNHPEVDLAVVDSPVQLGHPPHHTDRSIFKKNLSLVKIVLDPASFYCVPPIFHSNQRREVLYFSYFRPNIISLRTQQSSAGHTVQHTGLSAGLEENVFSPVSVLVTVNFRLSSSLSSLLHLQCTTIISTSGQLCRAKLGAVKVKVNLPNDLESFNSPR